MIRNLSLKGLVEDDLESSLYVLLWTALKYSSTYMDIVDRTLLMVQVFDGGSLKEGWLMTRTNLPEDVFVGRKSLDNLVVELCVFFSHRYATIPEQEQAALANLRAVLLQAQDRDPLLYSAAQKFISESLAYKKEMGMKIMHLHDSVIEIYDKHLEVPGWPQDPAVEQAVLFTKPPVQHDNKVSAVFAGRKDDNGGPDDDETLSVTGLDELASLS
ncbi:hypothetical protein EDD22DRAFT_960201 [Suillus occidentalis]|nr:hypothetical protein EDD22DRAFT_960201 [Suillus occidentalis]